MLYVNEKRDVFRAHDQTARAAGSAGDASAANFSFHVLDGVLYEWPIGPSEKHLNPRARLDQTGWSGSRVAFDGEHANG